MVRPLCQPVPECVIKLTFVQPVCQYFLRGECRFGDKCKYEHPQNPRPQFGSA